MVETSTVSNGVKVVLVSIIGLFILWNTFVNAAPTVFGNTSSAVWVLGVNLAWIGTILPYILALVVCLGIIYFL